MVQSTVLSPSYEVYAQALASRDARFDGLFFVGVTSTHIYCRPVCPARVSYPEHRRFFDSAASAEHAGFRPCLRCRPELAPGRALIDAVPRLAGVAAHRIAAGALNGGSVAALARDLGVSERHLRRALERELGVSPLELALTHRLLLAKQLLADTALPVTRVAFASGFQSLRRFNAAFRERYRLSPSRLRRPRDSAARPPGDSGDLVRLTLPYRDPLAWRELVARLGRRALRGVEWVRGARYGRTVGRGACRGVLFAELGSSAGGKSAARSDLRVDVSSSLLPMLMPLLSRLRHLFDLDAEPAVVDAHLAQAGLGALVRRRPGLRIPGAWDSFEVVLQELLADAAPPGAASPVIGRIVAVLGEAFDSGHPALTRFAPTADRVAAAGLARLAALGAAPRVAAALVSLARAMADGELRLEPGRDAAEARRGLMELGGLGDRLATTIVMRTLSWPDAFPAQDPALQRAAGDASAAELLERAEAWRPWRAYAAQHLWLTRQTWPAPTDGLERRNRNTTSRSRE